MKGELELLATVRARLGGEHAGVDIGIGDDAAVLEPSDASSVHTIDVAVEGTHFERGLAPWEDIGRRAFVAAISDLAAMGARPRGALLSLILPADLEDDVVPALADGIAHAAREHSCPVIGGNLSAGSQLSITTTVIGAIGGAPLRRDGARDGDGVYVSGTIGDAGLGLALLQAGLGDDPRQNVQRFIEGWRRPSAALLLGQRLAGQASAAIDVSDGVLRDLSHICEASGAGAVIEAPSLPRGRGFEELARELGLDPLELALSSGEDYRLLFTAPASGVSKDLGTRIGRVTGEHAGVRVLDAGGAPIDVERQGWEHFRG